MPTRSLARETLSFPSCCRSAVTLLVAGAGALLPRRRLPAATQAGEQSQHCRSAACSRAETLPAAGLLGRPPRPRLPLRPLRRLRPLEAQAVQPQRRRRFLAAGLQARRRHPSLAQQHEEHQRSRDLRRHRRHRACPTSSLRHQLSLHRRRFPSEVCHPTHHPRRSQAVDRHREAHPPVQVPHHRLRRHVPRAVRQRWCRLLLHARQRPWQREAPLPCWPRSRLASN